MRGGEDNIKVYLREIGCEVVRIILKCILEK